MQLRSGRELAIAVTIPSNLSYYVSGEGGTPFKVRIGATIEKKGDPETWSVREQHREQEGVDSWPGTRIL
jgi:hypothetical protein